MKLNANKIARMGILSALSVLLMLVIHFPIFPSAAFLEFDIANVPILIGTFLYGPIEGLIITFVVCVIQAATVSQASGIAGAFMHFVATGTLVIVAGYIYKKVHTLKGAIIGLIAGSLAMTGAMVLLNLVVTPRFLGVPVEVIVPMLLPIIVPFNIIKSFGNSLIVLLVYKSAGRVLRIPQKTLTQSVEGKDFKAVK